MGKSKSSKLGAFLACIILILAMGVFGYIYADYYTGDQGLKLSFFELENVETTAKVGSRGYYVDLDVCFISDDEKATRRLGGLEDKLKDIVVESVGMINGDIRTPEGKKLSQRTILKRVRNLAPEIFDVAFTNFLMVPLYGAKPEETIGNK